MTGRLLMEWEEKENAYSVIFMSKVVSMVMEGVFLFVLLNSGKYCFWVSPLWCGACSLPITQLRCMIWLSGPALLWWHERVSFSVLQQQVFLTPVLPLPPQVSLLEYRKRKQGSGRDSEPVGSSSLLSSTPTQPGSHYSQDSSHSHAPASPYSSFSSSAHTPSIPQIEEVSPPDHQGPSVPLRRQDNNNQWWEGQRDDYI